MTALSSYPLENWRSNSNFERGTSELIPQSLRDHVQKVSSPAINNRNTENQDLGLCAERTLFLMNFYSYTAYGWGRVIWGIILEPEVLRCNEMLSLKIIS